MKKSEIQHIFFFCFILCIMMYIVHGMLMSGLLSNRKGEFGLRNQFFNGEINSKVIILGNSRARNQFDCQIIENLTGKSCFNVGMAGSMVNMQLPILQAYLLHNQPPEVVVQVLGPQELSNFQMESKDLVPYLNQPFIYERLIHLSPNLYKHKYVPLYSFAVFGEDLVEPALRGLFNREKEPKNRMVKGFVSSNLPWDGSYERIKARYPQGMMLEIYQPSVVDLKTMVQAAQVNGSQIIFVIPPAYYEVNDFYLNINEVFDIYKSVAKELNIPLLDYSKIPLTKNKKYFHNAQHLNGRGAAIFSNRFAVDLREALKAVN